MGLVAVLQKIYESLREAIPQQWITLAADISDLMAVRRDFVEDSARLFNRRKDLLDRFISLRAIYVLTILRDLGRLKKVGFDAHVRLLISALDVDMTAVMNKLNAKDSRRFPIRIPTRQSGPAYYYSASCSNADSRLRRAAEWLGSGCKSTGFVVCCTFDF